MYMLRRSRSPGDARFRAVPVLAAGLMLSCGEAPRPMPEPALQSSVAPKPPPSPQERAGPKMAMAPQARADSAYPLGYTVGCPEWMVRVPDSPYDFCIDRFEAVIALMQGGRITIHDPSKALEAKDLAKMQATISPLMPPQSSVKKQHAKAACNNAGKRLCTVHEWKRACMGPLDTTYPYGNKEEPDIYRAGKLVRKGTCNTRKPHILSIFHGADNSKWNSSDMKDPLLNRVKGFLAKPGEYAGCVSGYGAYDMVGNLHEWVSDLVDKRILASMPNTGKQIPGVAGRVGNSIFMGGFFSTGSENGPGCHYMTIAHGGDQDDYSVGFRCCKTVE